MKIDKSFDKISDKEKKLLYMLHVKPVINLSALFSDATEFYRNPVEPDFNENVTIRLRAAKCNIEEAFIIINNQSVKMIRGFSDDMFDYFEVDIEVGNDKLEYYFEVRIGKVVYYYNQAGPVNEINTKFHFCIIPGFKTPNWAKGAVMYQIFVDRFYNGDLTNDVCEMEYRYLGQPVHAVKEWSKNPANNSVGDFYGGDLQGVLDKLDYLESLGVEVIYLNPLFLSPSNHKYDTQDYDYVDPHFGVIIEEHGEVLSNNEESNSNATLYINRVTNKNNLEASNRLFVKLVEEIHLRGMKVIIDGVFNHCGSFHKWFDREHIYKNSTEDYKPGAFIDNQSPYRHFFHFYENQWPDNTKYDGWWGNETLPKLNYEGSRELEEAIFVIARKWISPPYNVDGWRLDVAADLGSSKEYNHYFWKNFRQMVKQANPEALILAENYGDSCDWLQGDQWDTIMNYDAFMEPVTWFLTGMEKHSDEYRQDLYGNAEYFFSTMKNNMARLGSQAVSIAMNQLSNHDHSRFLTRTNKTVGRIQTKGTEAASENINKAVFREAIVIQMTWPGSPTVYYGDEAGLCGWTDPDNRRTYPWGNEDQELLNFHREIIRIHKENEILKKGSLKQLFCDFNIISYGRFDYKNVIIVVINNNDTHCRIKIPVWELGIANNAVLNQILTSDDNGFYLDSMDYTCQNGCIEVDLEKTSAVILKKY